MIGPADLPEDAALFLRIVNGEPSPEDLERGEELWGPRGERRSGRQPSLRPEPVDPDLIPDLTGSIPYQPSEDEAGRDRLARSVDILDAYARWCGKMAPSARGRREGIMISCPCPDHLDEHPSASINLDKQVWHCHRCCVGGDAFDIAAYYFGYSVPGYKTDGSFPDLVDAMARDLGWTRQVAAPSRPESPADADPAASPAEPEPVSAPSKSDPAPVRASSPGHQFDDAFVGIVGELVDSLDPISEAHPMAVLVQFVVAVGSLIGHGPFVMIGDSAHHANEYCVIVGNSAKARKGTSWASVHRVLAAVDSEWSTQRVVEGLSSGEGLVEALRDPTVVEEEDPAGGTPTRRTVDPGVADKRMLCQESEFASVLKVAARDGNTVSPRIRSAWDTGRMQIMTRKNPLRVTDAHVSIIGHCTTFELGTQLSKTDMMNGFANRFLWVHVHRSKRLARPRPLPESVIRDFADRLIPIVAAASARGRVELSPEAELLWEDLYDQFPDGDRRADVIAARAEAHVLRLALVYALLDTSEHIEQRHLRSAMAIWWYCWDSIAKIFGDTDAGSLQSKICDLIRSAGSDGLPRGELTRLLRHIARAAEIAEALTSLEAANTIRTARVVTAGRPMERWFIV